MKKSKKELRRWLQEIGVRNERGRFFLPCECLTKEVDHDERTLVVTISTNMRDRQGDILEPSGVDLSRYQANPVVLWAHEYSMPPIAKSLWVKVDRDRIIAKPQFAKTPMAEEIFSLYAEGYLKAWSVGFTPIEWETIKDEKNHFQGYHIKKWELLEYSAVPIPANPEALTERYESGGVSIHEPMLVKALGLKSKCGYRRHKLENADTGGTSCGLKDSSTEAAIKSGIPHEETPRDPEDAEWDAAVEIEEADVKDLAAMCAWVDDDNPKDKSSYKLPHHRAAGKHNVVWKGVAEAMSVLLDGSEGVDIPEDDLQDVYDHLARHYEEFDKEVPELESSSTEDEPAAGAGDSADPATPMAESAVASFLSKGHKVDDEEAGDDEVTDEDGTDELESARDSLKEALESLESVLEMLERLVEAEFDDGNSPPEISGEQSAEVRLMRTKVGEPGKSGGGEVSTLDADVAERLLENVGVSVERVIRRMQGKVD